MSLDYEFRYNGNRTPLNGTATISINSNCYSTELAFAQELAERLRAAVPFQVELFGKPSMHILGGNRSKGVMSVEMGIKFSVPDATAAQAFADAGWFTSLEYILG